MSPESGAVVENPLVKTPADNPFGGDFPGPRSRGSDRLDGLDPYALYVAFEDAKDFIRRLADGGHEGARAWMDSHGVRHGRIAKQWRRRLTGRHE